MPLQPDPNLLMQVVQMLEYTLAPDSNLLKQANEFLAQNSANPQFVLYLVHVFIRLREAPSKIRHIAGVTLKSVIDRWYVSLPEDVRNSLRLEILDGLIDDTREIRRAAANCITTIVRLASLSAWPTLPGLIASALTSSNLMAQNGALEAIVMLSEDTCDQWIYPDNVPLVGPGSTGQLIPLNSVMQPLFQLMSSSDSKTKLLAATAMLHFATGNLEKAAFVQYLKILSTLTNDMDVQIKCIVIKSLSCIVRSAWDVALPSIGDILRYVVESVNDKNDEVAKAACEFFEDFSTSAITQDEVETQMRERAGQEPHWLGSNQGNLLPQLPLLVALLVSRMQMTEEDLSLMSYNNDVGNTPDRVQDVRPHIRRGSSTAFSSDVVKSTALQNTNDDDGEGNDDDDDDDTHGEVKTFTVRQGAARTLEFLSSCYNSEVADVLVPDIKRLISIGTDSARWIERELAVLALGTISDGCCEDINDDLPHFLMYLLSLLKDPYPCVRAISAWAIGRYAKWISDKDAEAVENNDTNGLILRGCIECLSAALQDTNRGVQQSTCSALYCFASYSANAMAPFADIILSSAMNSLMRYQVRSRISIYDMLSRCADETVFDEVLGSGDALCKFRCDSVMNALVPQFVCMDSADPELCPLFELLSYLVRPMGPNFAVSCRDIFPKTIELINLDITSAMSFAVTNPGQIPDLQRAAIGLDMMDSIFSLGPASAELLDWPVGAGLIELVSHCVTLSYNEVRCSGFVLIGTLCDVSPWEKLAPFCQVFVNACVDTIHLYSISSPTVKLNTCNNAVWALGKLAVHIGTQMAPLVTAISERFIRILIRREGVNSTLSQNIAITLGVFSEYCSANCVVATIGRAPLKSDSDWSIWSMSWLTACKGCNDPAEKRQALIGFCHAVSASPSSLYRHIPVLAETFSGAFEKPNEKNAKVFSAMATVLNNFKAVMGQQWEVMFDQLSDQVRSNLAQRLGIFR
jgi:transportin-1